MLACNKISAAKYIGGHRSWSIDLTRTPTSWRKVDDAIVAFLQSLRISAYDGTVEGETIGELHVAALVTDIIDDDETDPQQYAEGYYAPDYVVGVSAHEVTLQRTERGTIVRVGYTWTTEAR